MQCMEAIAPDRFIAALAARQHGVVSLADLRDAGLGRGAIAHRVRAGRLHRLHRGVYAVGHSRISQHGAWLAAVLACGDGALLSHGAAGALWELRTSSSPRFDVTLPTRAGRERRPEIRMHRPRAPVPDAHVARHRAIAVTSVAWTLVDLADALPASSTARAVERANALALFDLHAVRDALAHHPARRGVARLAVALDAHRDDTITRSELETMFLALCAAHDVPRPAVNVRVEDLEVDFLWRAQRVIAETDGHRDHGTRAAFERDRARDARLAVAGYRVVRFTYRQVERGPAAVATTLRALLEPPR